MRPGPGSASWRINGERVVVLGWPRAILLQFAHPLIAAGVAEHSSFQTSRAAPIARLHGTIRAMLAMTFGDSDTAHAAADRINRIHDRVNGTLRDAAGPFPAGLPYSAHNPDLLAWVQLTLLDTMPRAYELLVAPLSTAEKDRYCAEARTGARLLGVPDDLVPTTYEEVCTALAARVGDGSLVVTDTARALARDILMPRTPVPWAARRIHRLVTVGLLPPTLRDAYGLEWSRRDEVSLASWSARIRRLSVYVPGSLRRWRAGRG
jgi:uncharacterized protein (DUF2236 family)